jgi:uncharacterized C2H2 Zn-finger protein
MNSFLDPTMKMSESVSPNGDVDAFYDVQLVGKKQNFICKFPDCGKVFRYKSEILRHIATHSNFRPHMCTFDGCKKSFKRQDALENHIRTHTKETPFQCTVSDCGMMFTTKASLRYHVLKHRNQKVYKCNFPGCNKAFITVFQLKQHEKSACIHKKIKVSRDEPDHGFANPVSLDLSNDMMMNEKESMMHSARPKIVEWEFKPQAPVQKYEENSNHFDYKVRNILTENQLLKKRLEFSQKIITLLQQKNDPMPYLDSSADMMSEGAPFFLRPSLYQGQIFE